MRSPLEQNLAACNAPGRFKQADDRIAGEGIYRRPIPPQRPKFPLVRCPMKRHPPDAKGAWRVGISITRLRTDNTGVDGHGRLNSVLG